MIATVIVGIVVRTVVVGVVEGIVVRTVVGVVEGIVVRTIVGTVEGIVIGVVPLIVVVALININLENMNYLTLNNDLINDTTFYLGH